jgi:hypothetical protein
MSAAAAFPAGKPPWRARNAREKEWFAQWSLNQLAQPPHGVAISDDDCDFAASPPAHVQGREIYNRALQLARRGDVQLLRKLIGQIFPEVLDPQICEIRPPRRVRGQRSQYANGFDHWANAWIADDVKRLHEIWKTEYGRWKRHAADGHSAEHIVALRWRLFEGEGEDQVANEDAVRACIKAVSRGR